MPLTHDQAAHIAPIIAACRPYGARRWDAPGIVAALMKVADRSLPEILRAATRAAEDRSAETPAVIAAANSLHWRERALEPVPTKPVVCRIHGTQHSGGICPSCRSDDLAPGDIAGDTRPGERMPAEAAHLTTVETVSLHTHASPITRYLSALGAEPRPKLFNRGSARCSGAEVLDGNGKAV